MMVYDLIPTYLGSISIIPLYTLNNLVFFHCSNEGLGWDHQ